MTKNRHEARRVGRPANPLEAGERNKAISPAICRQAGVKKGPASQPGLSRKRYLPNVLSKKRIVLTKTNIIKLSWVAAANSSPAEARAQRQSDRSAARPTHGCKITATKPLQKYTFVRFLVISYKNAFDMSSASPRRGVSARLQQQLRPPPLLWPPPPWPWGECRRAASSQTSGRAANGGR